MSDERNRVQGMVRSMDQWRNMVPAAVSVGSQAHVEYALNDAKTDISALWASNERLLSIIIKLHVEGTLSEGQAAKATGLHRVDVRKLADDMVNA